MIITYYGKQFFKIQLGDLVVAFNPFSKGSNVIATGVKVPRFSASIALVSLNHPDFNGVENLSHGDKTPFLIYGPGEYEIKEVFIKGFIKKTNYEGEEKINTIYYMSLDGMNICFLGALDDIEMSSEIREAISTVDILFVPIGNGDTLNPSSAHKLSRSFNPKIIIPMDFGDIKSSELKKFLDETGTENGKPVDKLTVKKKDIEEREGDVVVIKPL